MTKARGRGFSPGPVQATFAGVALVFALHWFGVPLLDEFELRTYDLRLRSRGQVEPHPAVVLAVIDEQSLDRFGRWPWSRTRIAALVDTLSAAGVRVIAFDIGFLEPESLEADAALARAIESSSADVVLGYFFQTDAPDGGVSGYAFDPARQEEELDRLAPHALTVRYRSSDPDRSPFLTGRAPEGNLPGLSAVAEGAGFFSLVPDEDGIVRRIPLVMQCGDDVFPALALASAWMALGRPPLLVDVVDDRAEAVWLGDRMLPVDTRGRLMLDYPGPAGTFPSFPVAAILDGEVPADALRDRIVLVGVTATGIFDLRATPFGPVYPGLEVQATALDDILTGRFLTRPGWADLVDQLAIVVLGVATGLLTAWLGAASAALAVLGLATAYVVAVRQVFVVAWGWVKLVYPLLSLAAVYAATTLTGYLREQRERRRVSDAFGQYVSPIVIEQMLSDPDKLRLGGEERELTVLFSDLASFTTMSERYAPSETIELLSEYYTRMTEAIYAAEGMLKEYVGDELMAIFGAPMPRDDHAVQACHAALLLREARTALARDWARKGWPALRARTGVNSGRMLVGNIGSEYRFSYGVLGDAVNTGSRLEGLNKAYGTEILVGERTAELVGDAFRLREVDSVRVMGKQRSLRVFELIGEAGVALAPGQEKALAHYEAALALHRRRDWTRALDELEASQQLLPGDVPSRLLAERCRALRTAPPPDDWDGVFEATEK